MYKNAKDTKATIADFRSDTVTLPTPEMLQSLPSTITGDDVFSEDSTINLLESKIASLTGKEAALFCTSGTLSNQLAIRTHLVQPPYSVLCDREAHVNQYEAGGISFHTGAHVIPVDCESHLTLDHVKKNLVLDDDVHHARTQLICMENTKNGLINPLKDQLEISHYAKSNGIKMHLDGARLWNASIATNTPLSELCKPYDSVSLCFSKGLGAPVGSTLVGSKAFIQKARHFRKLYGGGWRQAGLLAQCCLHVLEFHFPKLSIDHSNAQLLATGLQSSGFKLSKKCETNMVWVDLSSHGLNCQQVSDHLQKYGVRVFGGESSEIRFVLHHQISREAVLKTVDLLSSLIKAKV